MQCMPAFHAEWFREGLWSRLDLLPLFLLFPPWYNFAVVNENNSNGVGGVNSISKEKIDAGCSLKLQDTKAGEETTNVAYQKNRAR